MTLSLSDYLHAVSSNADANLREQGPCVESLESIGEAFHAILDASAVRQVGQVFFVGMSYSNFLAASELALSGRLVPSQSMGRATVEAASYAFWTMRHPEHFISWKERDQGEEQRKRARRAFVMKPILDEIKAEQPAIGHQLELSYETSIDLGAHPNYSALVMGMVNGADGAGEWRFVDSDPTSVKFGLMVAGHSGTTALGVLLQTFGDDLRNSAAGPRIVAAMEKWSDCEKDLNPE